MSSHALLQAQHVGKVVEKYHLATNVHSRDLYSLAHHLRPYQNHQGWAINLADIVGKVYGPQFPLFKID